jgi:predicted DsbA family dithiol-disulfide isomerase
MPELEIFSDFNCTWCYFDKPSINKLEVEYEVAIRWRAFPLHPDIPEGGMSIEALFGHNFALMTDKMKQLEARAASLGLALAKRTTISDSRLSQELSKWAQTNSPRTWSDGRVSKTTRIPAERLPWLDKRRETSGDKSEKAPPNA